MSGADAADESPDEPKAAILEESRRVLDHQIDGIHTVENKAAWTLRIGVVLLGALISAVRLFTVSDLHVLVFVGVASIALSLVVGIVAYSVSAVDVGAEPATVDEEVPDDFGCSDVYDAVLAAHEDSIQFNEGTLRVNEWFLTLTQALLAVGISLAIAGFLVST